MFFHGIKWEYVIREYPVLSPRRTVRGKRKEQLLDRLHLLQMFGVEPIHLLEADAGYPPERCIKECLAFGDTVFAFERLCLPIWQLSSHEVGVEVLDVRSSVLIYTTNHEAKVERYFPGIPCFRDEIPSKFS